MKKFLNFRSTPLILCIFLLLLSNIPSIHGQNIPGSIVYSVPGMDKVVVRPNIVYNRDGQDEMKMDIYIPPDLASDIRIPAVILIHGGPLGNNNPFSKLKDLPFFRSYGKLMAASGLVGITFNHRYADIGSKGMETSFSDVEAAINFVRTESASYHIDPDRIALWVFSGGGPHLSIVLRNQMKFIRCMVSYYGVLDIHTIAKLIGGTPSQSLEKYNPITYLTKEYDYRPPLLIARAGRDYVPETNHDVEKFFSRMLSLNSDVSLLNHPSGLHGFDYLNDDEQSRYIIKTTILFLKSHL